MGAGFPPHHCQLSAAEVQIRGEWKREGVKKVSHMASSRTKTIQSQNTTVSFKFLTL